MEFKQIGCPYVFTAAPSSVCPFLLCIMFQEFQNMHGSQLFWLSQLIIEHLLVWTVNTPFPLCFFPLSNLHLLLPSSPPFFHPSLSSLPLSLPPHSTSSNTSYSKEVCWSSNYYTTISTSNGEHCICALSLFETTSFGFFPLPQELESLQDTLSVRGGELKAGEERELEQEEGHWSLPRDDECWCH